MPRITLTVDTSTEEAQQLAEALNLLVSSISTKDIAIIAEYVSENPAQVNTIKKWIENPPPVIANLAKMLS